MGISFISVVGIHYLGERFPIMPVLSNRVPVSRLIIAALSAIPAIFLLLVTNQYKMGISPDATNYISMGESIASGHGVAIADMFTISGWRPISTWPPLYPLLIALFIKISIPPMLSTWIINGALFFLTLFLSGLLFFKISGRLLNTAVFLLLISMAGPFLSVYSWALSEPLFIFLIICYFWAFLKFTETKKAAWFVALCMTVVLATFTRYIGGVLLPLTALFLLWQLKMPIFKRLGAVSGFCLLTALPLIGWSMRNKQLTGRASGAIFGKNLNPLDENLLIASKTVSSWFLPIVKWPSLTALIFMALIVILGFWLNYKLGKTQSVANSKSVQQIYNFQLIFSIVFWLVTVGMSSVLFIWWPDHRLLSPIMISLVFVIYGGLCGIFAQFSKITKTVLVITLLICLVLSTINQLRWANHVMENGVDGTGIKLWTLMNTEGRQRTSAWMRDQYISIERIKQTRPR